MKRISKYITQFNIGSSNCYLIEGNDGLSLIDTGGTNNAERIVRAINQAGYDLHSLKRILISHAHSDHYGSLAEMQQRTGAEVWAHELDAPVIEGHKEHDVVAEDDCNAIDRLLLKMSPSDVSSCTVHRKLRAAQAIPEVLEGLEVIHLPGHTVGQIGFWLPRESLLIGGDVMMNIMGRLTQPFRVFTPDTAESKKSIVKASNLQLNTLALGHGPVIEKHADKKINKLITRFSSPTNPTLLNSAS